MAETVGYAKIELELDDRKLNAGLTTAATKIGTVQKQVAAIDFRKLSAGAENLASGIGKVLTVSRALTGVLVAGSIAAALKDGGAEAQRLQSRLGSVKGAFAGLGERLLRERVFGRQAADWAQRIADGLNSIDSAKIARLVELVVGMQALKTGADVFSGLAKVASMGQGSGAATAIASGAGAFAGGVAARGAAAYTPKMQSADLALLARHGLSGMPRKAAASEVPDWVSAAVTKGKAASTAKASAAASATATKTTVSAASGLKALGGAAIRMVGVLGALYLASQAVAWAMKKWDLNGAQALDKSREGLRHAYDGLAQALKKQAVARGIDSALPGEMTSAAARTTLDSRFGRTLGADTISAGAQQASAAIPKLKALRDGEEARLKSADTGIEQARRALSEARQSGDLSRVDGAEVELAKLETVREGIAESVKKNLETLDEALRNAEQFKDGLRSAAAALFEHAESVREAEDQHSAAVAAATATYEDAIKKLRPSGAAINVASTDWNDRFQQAVLGGEQRRENIADAETEMEKATLASAEELTKVRDELEKSNARADRMEQFFKEKLGQSSF